MVLSDLQPKSRVSAAGYAPKQNLQTWKPHETTDIGDLESALAVPDLSHYSGPIQRTLGCHSLTVAFSYGHIQMVQYPRNDVVIVLLVRPGLGGAMIYYLSDLRASDFCCL